MAETWKSIELDSDPRFIIGYRKPSGMIDCYRVEIHQDIFEELRAIARDTLNYLDARTQRPYAPFGALDEDEYFMLSADEIPRRESPIARHQDRSGRDSPMPASLRDSADPIAEALRIVNETDEHSVINPRELREGARLNLYAISFLVGNHFVGFIRKANPRGSIRPGMRLFRYGDTLKKIDKPDIVIDDRVDVIVTPAEVAILSEASVQMLFRDVEVVMRDVDENVSRVVAEFSNNVPITAAGVEALRRACKRGPRNARRLYDLTNYRMQEINLHHAHLISTLRRRGLSHVLVNGQLDLTDDTISAFFDYVEGRLFDDDHSPELRRADRFSVRQ